MRSMTVIVDGMGQTTVEAHGYVGGKCKQATAPLTGALIGGSADESKVKPEFYQADNVHKVAEFEGR